MKGFVKAIFSKSNLKALYSSFTLAVFLTPILFFVPTVFFDPTVFFTSVLFFALVVFSIFAMFFTLVIFFTLTIAITFFKKVAVPLLLNLRFYFKALFLMVFCFTSLSSFSSGSDFVSVLDAVEKKPTVCTITINSSDEKEVFKSYLGGEFNFVELTDFKEQGDKDWFLGACKQGLECDILVVSGHFGGSFFGETDYRLSLSELQRRSCQRICDGILKRPKEVFLFGCNTTAGKNQDHRTPEEYTRVLINDGFSRRQAEQISAFRYSPIGEEMRDRFQQVFPHSRIYGFHSQAPLGLHIVPRLNEYFESISDYESHLEGFPTEDENLLWSSAMKGQWIRSVNGNEEIENPVCVLEENKPLYKKLDWIDEVLSNEEKSLAYIPVIDEYLKDIEKRFGKEWESFPKAELSVMESIQFNEEGRKRVDELLLSPIEGVISAQVGVLDFGKRVAWYDEADYLRRLRLLIGDIFNENLDREQLDFICSLDVELDLRLEDLPEERWNQNTIGAIGCVKPKDIRIHQALVAVLREDSNSDVRTYAIWALGEIGSSSPEVISVLLSALGDSNSYVRAQAAGALGKIGSSSPEAISALVSALGDSNSHVRAYAAWALGEIGSSSPEAISALVSALGDSNSYVRVNASWALREIGSSSPEVVISALVSALGDSNSDVRAHAALALGKIGSSSPEVISALVSALGDSNSDVRTHAAEALGKIGSSSPEVISALVSALGDSNSDVRAYAAGALEKIGSSSPKVISALVSALGDSNSYVRVHAVWVLEEIGSSSPEVISALVSALGDSNSDVRKSAREALEKIGSSSPKVISALVSALGDSNSDVRFHVVRALGKIGSSSPEVISALVSALVDSDSYVRFHAAWVLGKIGSSSPKVISALLSALGDSNSDVRAYAAWALGKIGSSSPKVISALVSTLGDSNSDVRKSAREALEKIGSSSPRL